MMKILVLYKINYPNVRNTIREHLFSFKRYARDTQFHYFNVKNRIPQYLSKIKYEGIIIHYTFLAQRIHKTDEDWKHFIKGINKLHGYKVAIPQDEYDDTDKLCHLFKTQGVKTVFTCFPREEDYLHAYPPEETGLANYIPVLTGYVDENAVKQIEPLTKQYEKRPIDIGYRARKLPYYLGKHGQLKTEITEVFAGKLQNTNLKYDISNTGDDKNTFFGQDWYKFLLSCKAFLGCEGGSSLLDKTGKIKEKVMEYEKKHPNASFREVEKHCFPGVDSNIRCFAFSPRHFEAIITKTLQVLVEGDYSGILKANKHYIPIKKDFSNIDEILEKLKNAQYCQDMINTAYDDIILSGKYTYGKFVETVLGHIKEKNEEIKTKQNAFEIFGGLISARNALYTAYIYFLYYGIIYRIKATWMEKLIQKNEHLFAFARKILKKCR